MNLRRRFALIGFLLVSSFFCIGQVNPIQVNKDYSYTTSFNDYDALSINPANIAAHKSDAKKVSFGLWHTDAILYSSVLKRDIFHNKVAKDENRIINKMLNDGGLWIDDILVERTALNMDMTILGFNFHTKKAGSFALSAKVNVNLDAEINGVFEELDYDESGFSNYTSVIMQTIVNNLNKTGNEIDDPSDNSYLRLTVLNEINFGYSNLLVNKSKLKLFGGFGVKYILGLADAGIEFDENQLKGYYAISSLIPTNLEEHNVVEETKSDQKFGNGFGSSFGVTMVMNKLRVGISFLDMGFIRWPAKTIYVTQEDAFEIAEGKVDKEIAELVNDFQRKSEHVEMLPAKFILGTSYEAHKYVHFYLDFATPMNKSLRNLSNPTIGIGTLLSVMNYLTFKFGPTLSGKDLVTFPTYISIFAGKHKTFELSAGTADLISYFRSNRNYVQANVALMKFHF